MKTKTALLFGTIIISAIAAITVMAESSRVTLKLKFDGRLRPAPSQVIFDFDGQSKQLPVEHQMLKLPLEIRTAKSVSMSFRFEKEWIRISDINLAKFRGGSWTILLDDTDFGEEYRWVIPKGAVIRSSCIWVSEPTDGKVTATFVEGCRSKAR